MGARVLTIMATRGEDQALVARVAKDHGARGAGDLAQEAGDLVVPAFGWHPWFSYQLYDDITSSDGARGDKPLEEKTQVSRKAKAEHYGAVLTPTPDPSFIASLPEPQSLANLIAATRTRLEEHPLALVGEVGLDKAFRLPQAWTQAQHLARDDSLTPGGREGRLLSPYRVGMAHQVAVLKAQLRLAGEMGRAVSIHGVQAHGVLFDALQPLWKGHEREVTSRRKQKMVAPGAEDFSDSSDDEEDDNDNDDGGGGGGAARGGETRRPPEPKPFPPRICLHSFSGPVQVMKQYLHPSIPVRVFFSFSVVVNLSTAGAEDRFTEVVRACPEDQLLIESDLHCAGEEMDGYLEEMYGKVCDIKGWSLEQGLDRIKENYREFIFG